MDVFCFFLRTMVQQRSEQQEATTPRPRDRSSLNPTTRNTKNQTKPIYFLSLISRWTCLCLMNPHQAQ